MNKQWTVHLIYFKRTGKYYSEGEYISHKRYLFEIWDEVEEMFKQGQRPGLVDGANEFYVLVEVPGHPQEHPRLIL